MDSRCLIFPGLVISSGITSWVLDLEMECHFNPEKIKIGFSVIFCNLKIFLKHFSINPDANWTYGQNIENCATTPLRRKHNKGPYKSLTNSEDDFHASAGKRTFWWTEGLATNLAIVQSLPLRVISCMCTCHLCHVICVIYLVICATSYVTCHVSPGYKRLAFSKNRPLADSFRESRCPSLDMSLFM